MAKSQKILNQAKSVAKQLLGTLSSPQDQKQTFEAMLTLYKLFKETPDLRHFLFNPLIKKELKKDLVLSIFKKLKAPSYLNLFFGTFIDLGQAHCIQDVIREYITLYNKHTGRYIAKVITVKPLKPEDKKAIEEILDHYIEGDMEIQEKIDPSILGGLIVKINGKLFDGSLRSTVNHIEQALKGKHL